MRAKFFAALAVLVFSGTAVLGSVSATHGNWLLGVGQYEPNSKYDTSGYMFQQPNQARVDKVYFNGFFINAVATSSLTFSNVNPDGGNIYGPTGGYAVALLGYWRDCNRDNYVGLKGAAPTGVGSLGQYSPDAAAALGAPVDTSICPQGTSAYWPANEVSDSPNGLVDEWLAIAPCQNDLTDCDPDAPEQNPARVCLNPGGSGGALNCNAPGAIIVESPNRPAEQPPTDVLDNSSRVWGDWERPGKNHVPYGGLIPMPRGTWQDSDGTLKFIDDATIRAISSSVPDVWASKPNVGACNQPHPVFLGGPGGTCGLWPLYQFARLGNDTTCSSETATSGSCAHPDPLVTAFDTENDSNADGNPCNDLVSQDVIITNPANPSGTSTHFWISLPEPNPQVNPNILADGSISGTLVEASRAINGTGNPTADGPGDCRHHSNDNDNAISTNCGLYACESDDQASTFKHVEPTFKLNYTAGSGTRVLAQFGFDHVETETGHFILANDFSGWYANTVWTARPPRSGWGMITTTYHTFYADVSNQGLLGSAAVALPGGTQNRYTYGSDFCATITTGPSVVNALGWECSITEWQKVRDSLDPDDVTRYNAILGDRYDLRDVDCYDNTVDEDNLGPSVKLGIVDCASDEPAGTPPTHAN